jgi:hypothetical protein
MLLLPVKKLSIFTLTEDKWKQFVVTSAKISSNIVLNEKC